MGYLICQNCKGYYKLQDGEKPEDFTKSCACGGNLRYAINMDIINSKKIPVTKEEKKEDKKSRPDLPMNRKWILISGGIMALGGWIYSLWFSVLGVLILLLGFFLFFTDSWKMYLLIFAVWTFGGIFVFLFSIFSLGTLLWGFVIVIWGILNLGEIFDMRKKKIKGHIQ